LLLIKEKPGNCSEKPTLLDSNPALTQHLAKECNPWGLLTFEQGMFYSPTKREVDLMQAYCVKCRAKREMRDAKRITMKNGRPATQGVCPTCGTKMFRIGKS